MSVSPFSKIRFRISFIAWWLAIIFDHALIVYLLGHSWQISVIDSLISNFLLMLSCLAVMQILRFYMPRGRQYMNFFFICLFLTTAWSLLTKWLLNLSLGQYPGYPDFLHHSIPVRFSISFLLLGFSSMISMLWYHQQEQTELDKRNRDGEKLAKEAELFKLRQQLQPHFLFNSLNSINALIGSNPQEARKMVQQLSDFLRGTIKKEETQWVTLQEELQYLQLYLDIEKVRFGNRLATKIEVDENIKQLKLPSLILQPIVENAIKFGLYDITGETIIKIIAQKERNDLLIKVENPFDPETSSPQKGTGFGLKSVQRRLYLLFARNDLLNTQAKENIFTTTVKIPQHE
jgi:two-component system, LytTR family, sensor kinase